MRLSPNIHKLLTNAIPTSPSLSLSLSLSPDRFEALILVVDKAGGVGEQVTAPKQAPEHFTESPQAFRSFAVSPGFDVDHRS